MGNQVTDGSRQSSAWPSLNLQQYTRPHAVGDRGRLLLLYFELTAVYRYRDGRANTFLNRVEKAPSMFQSGKNHSFRR